jgi:hypothetical protein
LLPRVARIARSRASPAAIASRGIAFDFIRTAIPVRHISALTAQLSAKQGKLTMPLAWFDPRVQVRRAQQEKTISRWPIVFSWQGWESVNGTLEEWVKKSNEEITAIDDEIREIRELLVIPIDPTF